MSFTCAFLAAAGFAVMTPTTIALNLPGEPAVTLPCNDAAQRCAGQGTTVLFLPDINAAETIVVDGPAGRRVLDLSIPCAEQPS